MVRRAVPLHAPAHERWKRRWDTWFWSAMILAVGVHFGAFAFWPEMRAADISWTPAELEAITIPEKVEIPPPPEAIARPATPIIGDATVDPDITIHETTFLSNPVETLLAAPAPSRTAEDTRPTPESFTPFEVPPRILNPEEVSETLSREYPPLLRQAQIGGTVRVWFWIDESGVVRDRQVVETSGHTQLDDAALAVADIMRFSPAQNRDRNVQVGVTFPIRFVVR